jgi:hypothetical protein
MCNVSDICKLMFEDNGSKGVVLYISTRQGSAPKKNATRRATYNY